MTPVNSVTNTRWRYLPHNPKRSQGGIGSVHISVGTERDSHLTTARRLPGCGYHTLAPVESGYCPDTVGPDCAVTQMRPSAPRQQAPGRASASGASAKIVTTPAVVTFAI